jgi:uncharacterized protein
MTDDHDDTRPRRHLRVGIRFTNRSATVTSVWLVDAPATSTRAAGHPLVTRVDLGSRLADVARHADPRVQRSTMAGDLGHHYSQHDEGIVYVSVPFANATELSGLSIRIADATNVGPGPMDATQLAELMDAPPAKLGAVRTIGLAELQAVPDWSAVAVALGTPTQAGAFELYTDRAGRFRWRLRRSGGDIVAVSGEGFTTRAECEAELAWVRANAAHVAVTPLDVTPPA